MEEPATVLLAALGAFVLLVVVVSYVDANCLRGVVPAQREEYEGVSEYAERRNDEE